MCPFLLIDGHSHSCNIDSSQKTGTFNMFPNPVLLCKFHYYSKHPTKQIWLLLNSVFALHTLSNTKVKIKSHYSLIFWGSFLQHFGACLKKSNHAYMESKYFGELKRSCVWSLSNANTSWYYSNGVLCLQILKLFGTLKHFKCSLCHIFLFRTPFASHGIY
jgi:hypothetical protein